MSDRITAHSFNVECMGIAREIIDGLIDSDGTPDLTDDSLRWDLLDRARDAAWEYIGGHQWVIYYGYALEIAGSPSIDTSEGEDRAEDWGHDGLSFREMAVRITFAEMLSRTERECEEIIDAMADEQAEAQEVPA